MYGSRISAFLLSICFQLSILINTIFDPIASSYALCVRMSFFIVGVPNDLKDGKGTHADMAASVRPHANVYPLALPLDKFKVPRQ